MGLPSAHGIAVAIPLITSPLIADTTFATHSWRVSLARSLDRFARDRDHSVSSLSRKLDLKWRAPAFSNSGFASAEMLRADNGAMSMATHGDGV